MVAQVGLLGRSELAGASRLLARAFSDDPVLTHYLDDPERRPAALASFFEAVLEQALPSGAVFAARGDRLVGVAAWLPPCPVEPDGAGLDRARAARRVVEQLFPTGATALEEGFGALEKLHPEGPHWYLAFVGIEPAWQGRGLGRELLLPVLRLADETGTRCYLETPFPATHPFYESLGFALGDEHHPFPGSPHGVTTFLREPRP